MHEHHPHHPLEETRTTLEHLPLPGPVRRTVHRTLDRSNAAGVLSRPLLGVLPLRRWVPQDVHSLLDYANGLSVLALGGASGTRAGRRAGLALGLGVLGLSLCTDYRLSLAKWVPIELHEGSDYAWGLSVAAAPFVLGWARKSPWAAVAQVMVGLGTLVASLLTDYRCQTGKHLGHERMTDPWYISG
jgi:hypothetical protein